MQVTVHLHTILQRETPDGTIGRLEMSLPDESTLAELIEHLEIPLSPDHMILAVNRRMAELDQVLKDGDTVNLMPAISGG